MSGSGASGGVKRRHVFFLSGFDPKGASYYHGLYQTEALRRSGRGDMALTVSPRRRETSGNTSWTVKAPPCETVYEHLRWDDIVRRQWPRSLPRLLADTAFAYALYSACGAIARIRKIAPATARAGAIMGLLLPASLLASVLFAGLSGWLALHFGAGEPAAAAIALAVMCSGLMASNAMEKRYSTSWLSRIFAFTGKLSLGRVPEAETRIDAMAQAIALQLRNPEVDEVLVVGYSVGSILAVSAVARAIRREASAPTHAVLSLLTLGHCIPMLGLLPQAKGFRDELALLASHPPLHWNDFSAPGDWGSFAMVDPIKACRVPVADPQPGRPVLRSPRFHAMFAPEVYSILKRNKRRLHLQYLMTGDLPADYDYFAITSGPLTLAQRYPVEAPAP